MTNDSMRRSDFEAHALPQIDNLYRIAWYVLDNETDAQDVVNVSFARAYRSWLKNRVSPNCRVWLFKIMTNALIRKSGSSHNLSTTLSNADVTAGNVRLSQAVNQPTADGSDHVQLSGISGDDVTNAVRDLPRDLRLVVVLSLLEGFSYREIAEIAGITFENARTKLHQGRRLLQRELISPVAREGKYDLCEGRARRSHIG